MTVAYDPNKPPFHVMEDGELTGFSVEVFEAVAAAEGLRVEYRPLADHRAEEALAAEDVDIILTVSYSEMRADVMEFSNAYYSSSAGLFVPEDSQLDGISELNNQTAAVKRGSISREFLQNIRRLQFNETSDLQRAVRLLEQERADALVGEVTTVEHLLEARGLEAAYAPVDNYVVPIEYSFAVGAENYQLLRTLNRGLQELHEDGTYQELFTSWFPQHSGADQLRIALQVGGAAGLIIAVIILIGYRLNRRLQKEVARQTQRLHEANTSLQAQVEKTKNSNEFQKQILQSSPRGMVTIDENGMITSLNEKAAMLLNLSEDLAGGHYTEVSWFAYTLQNKFERVMQGRQYLGEESEWVRSDNMRLRLRAYMYPLYNFEQHIVGVMFTFEDITEEIQLRYQAFEAEKNRALSRVVAGIAHEIRNPLTSIKTFVELIPQKFHSEKFRERVTTLVPQEIERLNELIEGLMDYSKSRPIAQEKLDTAELLEGCYLLFERTAADKEVQLQLEVTPHLYVYADRQQMKQAVINLVINAVDALSEQAENADHEVVLENGTDGVYVWMAVRDNGPGMNDQVQRQAFEPFYTTKAEGTGLGLSITKQHVEENGGTFRIYSKEAEGTSVVLTFPTEDMDAEKSRG
ncbi:transporter substrate-binding domain-containing protein [Salsuginibacillus halophilus]|uniref:transporter substrate-binding domain-containing protein n=1 Tax=Salsuginibacillus halophilus TaxID=517424 RepID=UPI0015E741B8|nr:transporter substrate-binding domain-containing protein [Salsuginibacillus halophilus]